MPSVVDMNRSGASPAKGGGGRIQSISARAGQRPARAETKAPAPQAPAWRQTFPAEREGPRWQVKRDHHGGSNETGWRAGYSEIRSTQPVRFFQARSPLPPQTRWHRTSHHRVQPRIPKAVGSRRGTAVLGSQGQTTSSHKTTQSEQ